MGLSADALDQWRAARDMLLGARATLALGTGAAEGPELFGRIGDVAFDRDGNVLVLDAVNYEVRTFGPEGRHLGSLGGHGEGPMEFPGNLHSLEVLEDGRLLVGMRATGQGALISEDFPLIMRMTPEHFVAGWNDPYPRIEVHELDGS